MGSLPSHSFPVSPTFLPSSACLPPYPLPPYLFLFPSYILLPISSLSFIIRYYLYIPLSLFSSGIPALSPSLPYSSFLSLYLFSSSLTFPLFSFFYLPMIDIEWVSELFSQWFFHYS